MATNEKTPNEVLDYGWNWAVTGDDWLDGDTIATSTWEVEADNGESPVGVTLSNESNTTTTATVWASGGTKGARYRLINKIVTAAGGEGERTIYLTILKSRPDA